MSDASQGGGARRAPDCLDKRHDIFRATHPVQSADGQRVSIMCFCGATRTLPTEDWAAVEATRARLVRTKHEERTP